MGAGPRLRDDDYAKFAAACRADQAAARERKQREVCPARVGMRGLVRIWSVWLFLVALGVRCRTYRGALVQVHVVWCAVQ